MKTLSLPLLLTGSALLLASCNNDPAPSPDTTAPTVNVTANPTGVTAAGTVSLSANASDNVGVTKVEFYRGSTLIATDTAAPYTASDNVTSAQNGTLTYTAKAYDAAGNTQSASQNVTVNIAAPTGDQTLTVTGKVTELSVNSSTGAFTYTPWTGGAGKVNVAAGSKTNFAQGTLNADGNFSVVLPKPDASLLVGGANSSGLPEGCTGDLKVTGATDARSTGVDFTAQASKSGEIAPAALSMSADGKQLAVQVGAYVYFDKVAGLIGQLTCVENGASTSGTINAQFSAGWNKVSYSIVVNDSGTSSVSVTTGSVPAQWVYLGATGATPLSLSPRAQTLKAQALASVQALHLPFLR